MSDPVSQWRAKVNIASNRVGAINTALIAIQELHKPRFIGTESDGTPMYACMHCIREEGICKTRKLADEALAEHSNKETQ